MKFLFFLLLKYKFYVLFLHFCQHSSIFFRIIFDINADIFFFKNFDELLSENMNWITNFTIFIINFHAVCLKIKFPQPILLTYLRHSRVIEGDFADLVLIG